MKNLFVAATLAALAATVGAAPTVAQDRLTQGMGPPASPGAPIPLGPLPAQLSLARALEEAEARSPRIAAARAEVEAARGRARQASFRFNPIVNIDVENFAGTGPYSGFNGVETTVSVNQRLDLGGRRRSRMTLADAELAAAYYRLEIARADLGFNVRNLFALAAAARDNLALARDNEVRARELARVAQVMVDTGNEPPLRGLRADAALVQAAAALRTAESDEASARRSLAAALGADAPPAALRDGDLWVQPRQIDPRSTLDVKLAEVEQVIATAKLGQARAEGRVDPAVGIGVRQLRETGDRALIANVSIPLPIFDRNQGNVSAARSDIQAAAARRENVVIVARAHIANSQAELASAEARVAALEGSGIAQAREGVRLAALSYRAGKSSLVEYLDAQQAYADMQAALIMARRDRAKARAELSRQAAGTVDGDLAP